MKIIAFAGPSIARDRVEAVANVEWRPPVSQGDVYQAAKSAPDVIAIIDGYFDGVPSVWHKEILWALSQGIEVYGASSMGALRAAELHPFGMRGVGEIFEAYRDAIYEDDDEVAVLHGPAELNYLPLSLPMVNARATIQSAATSSIITQAVADALIVIAKSIFYQQRDWREITRQARNLEVDSDQIAAFERWLPQGERDLKQQDAQCLLDELSSISESGVNSIAAPFQFEWTVMWDRVVSGQTGRPPISSEASHRNLDQAVLDELRLEPVRFRELAQRVQLKQFALREAGRKRVRSDDALTRKQLQRLREALDLYTRADLDNWIEQNDWDASGVQQALENEQRSRAVMINVDAAALLDELRLSGDYPALKARASTKAAHGAASARELVPAQLLSWYFESMLGERIPADLDQYLAALGIERREDFYRMLGDHYHHLLALGAEKQ
ncbi:MAG: hypothetical protein GY875_01660 [Gammaproteobacteria bacterium]|nr:hypothetical protein [Gammaproteobacteria bacterium]